MKRSKGVWIFFSNLLRDRRGAIQTGHHLWRWGAAGTERDHHLFCGMVGPVQVKQFDCFPNLGPRLRQTIFNYHDRATLPCSEQIQTLFRTESSKIIYPVQWHVPVLKPHKGVPHPSPRGCCVTCFPIHAKGAKQLKKQNQKKQKNSDSL